MADGAAERDAESARRLVSGSLPVVANERLAQIVRTRAFTSDLSTDEFATLRSVGMDPVGQVMGTSVYRLGYIPYSCNYVNGFNPAPARVEPVASYARHLRHARELALGRLVAECRALGGDGVVGVTTTRRPFPGVSRTFEFAVTGTAVRARGRVRPTRPFTCDLSGQDVATLLRAGYVPTTLAYGISVAVRHDDFATRTANSAWSSNVEVPGYTELVTAARRWARQDFAAAARRTHADNTVLRDAELEFWSQDPNGHPDHFAVATLVGTAIAQFARRPSHAAPLTILRLDRRRPTTGRPT